MVLVLPNGRAALVDYMVLVQERFAEQSPVSEIILGLTVIIAALLLLILREGKPRQSAVYTVWTQTRGRLVVEDCPIVVSRPPAPARAGFFKRLRSAGRKACGMASARYRRLRAGIATVA